MTTTGIALPSEPVFDDETLAGMTWASLAQTLKDQGQVLESISDYGSGFTVLPNNDKRPLVGVPFIIVHWAFNRSKTFFDENGEATQFVSAYIVTEKGGKWILNDGGTGIAAQLRAVTERRVKNGHKTPNALLGVPGGLTVSEYPYTDEKGKVSTAVTYYLSESATAAPTL